MGAFKIEIIGVGGHGCDRKAKQGDKLFARCGQFNCPDCMAYEFVQQMRQKGMVRDGDSAFSIEVTPEKPAPDGVKVFEEDKYEYDEKTKQSSIVGKTGRKYYMVPMSATFTHWPNDEKNRVVDDMLKNERRSGNF